MTTRSGNAARSTARRSTVEGIRELLSCLRQFEAGPTGSRAAQEENGEVASQRQEEELGGSGAAATTRATDSGQSVGLHLRQNQPPIATLDDSVPIATRLFRIVEPRRLLLGHGVEDGRH